MLASDWLVGGVRVRVAGTKVTRALVFFKKVCLILVAIILFETADLSMDLSTSYGYTPWSSSSLHLLPKRFISPFSVFVFRVSVFKSNVEDSRILDPP